jgi:hypothetical protein
MELIILSLSGSLGALLLQLFEFVGHQPGRAPRTVTSAHSALRGQAELQTPHRAVVFRLRVAEHKRVRPSERGA